MAAVYYNDFDHNAAAWLRELMAAGLIPDGDVDERSIEDVRPDELVGYRHVHFFAGIGGWAYALRLAGWPDEWPVWTGSCPCQPYSQAGSRKGDDDPRALWWAWRWLIATSDGEDGGVADSEWFGRRGRDDGRSNGDAGGLHAETEAAGSGTAGGMADTEGQRRNGRQDSTGTAGRCCTQNGSGVAHAEGRRVVIRPETEREAKPSGVGADGFWDDAVWIPCADGKARRIKPGLEPLVDGIPGRVALLRGAGNAIVPQVAAVFVRAYMEAVSLVPPQRAGAAS